MRIEASLTKVVTAFIRERYGAQIAQGWYRDPFRVLVGCVLSQRTKEENTALACKSLFSVASTPRGILKLPLKRLEKLIKVAGLAAQKAKNIKRLSKILLEKHSGKVPSNREALLALPGVGPKTADVTLCYGFGVPCIPVDVHVNRISRRIGLIDDRVRVEEVSGLLQKIFPTKDWYLINRGFVLFGRDICLPRNPKCLLCPLNRVCKHGQQILKQRGKDELVID
jgi:endonuclease-3